MNTDQKDNEEDNGDAKEKLRTLKNNQTAALSALTKKLNEVSKCMEKPDNLHLVKTGMEEFEEGLKKYKDCHSDYLSQLPVNEHLSEIKRFEDKELSALGFRLQVHKWIATTEANLQDSMDGSSLRSRSHKSRRSVKSTASSVKSSLIQEKAKLADLLAQRALLEKQTEIAQQQTELKAKEDLLKLDGEIEAARAREKVFQEEVIPSTDKVLNPETPAFVPSHNVHQNKPNVTMPFLPMAPAPESFYQSQQQLAAAMMLPHAEATKFCGDLLEYASFMLAFNDRIVPHTTSDSNRLYFLNQHLEGKPKSLIAGCMFMNASEGYIEAKRLLDKVYGDPYKVSMAYVDKLTKWPQVRGDSSESLEEYALYLVKCSHTMQSLSNMQVLTDSPNLQRNAAEAAMDPVFSREALGKVCVFSKAKANHGSSQTKQKSFTVTVQPSNSANQYTRKCQLCGGHHDLEECPQFLHRSVDERREFVKDNRLCFSCLGNNHTSKRCLNRRQCKTFNKRHPTTLHIENFRMLDSNSAIVSQANAQSESTGQGCAKGQDGTQGEGRTPGQGNTQTPSNVRSSACTISDTVLQSILPVQLRVKGSDNDWPHLSSVINKISVYEPELDIGILIGSNCPTALQPLEVVPTLGYGPFAVRYLHGWTVNRPLHVKVSSNGVSCHRLLVSDVQHVTDCITVESIRKYFELDFSERDLGSVPDECGLSFEDTRFVKRCQDYIEFRDGHFQLPMPFRDRNVNLPNNKKQAVSRAKWQRRKMKNSEDYRQQYTAFMDKLFEKGYAYKILDDEVNKIPVWYLPHHAVFHPKKGKIRVVFYCSAKFEGVSLNDVLLQGPNLTNSLTGVLIRFRQEVYAFIGDIEAMFFQIKIPPENQDYATADKADEKYDSTVGNTIRHNFYVDDCLKSCADVPTAVKLVKNLVSASGEGGFRLTKFVSNSSDVLKALPAEDCSVESDKFNLDTESLMTRALGMLWDLKEDSFKFSIELKDNPFTRRGLLSTISSLYDPLGLVSPIILPAKKLLQELCQVESLDWDERIPDEPAERWQHWIQGLHLLEQLSIPRCFKSSGFGNVTGSSLVLFSDASTVGYGVAAYLVLHDGNQVQSNLVMGKSRVSPKKVVTIPRLELTAATVSVKVAQHILKELEFTVGKVVYYIDSTTVLHYIQSNTKRFPVFVANRVRVIKDYSQPEQWRYVNSSDNPADVASRGINVHQFLQYDEWFHGPSFIASDYLTSQELHKAVSVFQQLKSILSGKRKGCVTTDAERAIIMYVQREVFGDEVKALSREMSVGKSSPICKLDPFLDSEDGLLKVGGRIRRYDIPQSAKHPILLPKKHHVTTLLIRNEHELLAHSGRNHVLSNLRQKYWIINANATVRNMFFHCVTCRKLKEPALSQKMADLPADRLEPSPPFSNVGIDLFVPHYIKEGRKELKRYGVISTCLALRRFVSRRGHPKVIRCDNGTKFHGAERELKAALDEMEEKKIEKYLSLHHIEWKFNPPAASHMGGCWERQIRTVRKVSALVKEFGERLNDESLRTLLCEVESIVNSRPLTIVSDSIDDLEPLTPNHLLIPKSYVIPPPGLFQKDEVYMRRRWRCVQYLTNLFWSRFRKEYLSTLQTRQKWNEPRRNLIVGDVVLVKSDIEPRNHWPMGRVIEVYPDDTGTIRSAKIKTLSSVIVCPIQKLVLLVEG
ncbi:uncharacterized protein [Palaemon carinicauda]|uniref:uncharacterized protein n=1 Tax=Palaemon carinicauda TaxID=392227 RepID=UPI0035B63D35